MITGSGDEENQQFVEDCSDGSDLEASTEINRYGLTSQRSMESRNSAYSLKYNEDTESFLPNPSKQSSRRNSTSPAISLDFAGLSASRTFRENANSLVDMCDAFWYRQIAQSTTVFLFVVGVISAVFSWCFDEVVEYLLQHKYAYFAYVRESGLTSFYFTYYSFHLLCGLFAVFSTKLISPLAVGSGIPQIKSLLAGYTINDYLTLRTLVAKVLGLLLGILAALVIGTEGPFLHISCILAFNLAKLLPGFRDISTSPALIRQILSAASAVGVTSSFGAPIGGVLFSIEVTSSFYHVEEYWKGFFCSVCAALTFKELSYFGKTRASVVSLFATDFANLPYSFTELPIFIVLSIISGLLGGLFVKVYEKISIFYRENEFKLEFGGKMRKMVNSYTFAATVILLTLSLNLIGGDLMFIPLRNVLPDLLTSADIKDEFSVGNWENPSLILNLLKFFCFKYILAASAISVSIPCGLFTPVFAIGAAFGRGYGEFLHYFFGDTLAAGYALVGAASFTAGVTGTVSTAVIVFELTSQLSYMLPVLLAVLIGRSSAEIITRHHIYDSLARSRNLPLFPTLTKRAGYLLQVRQLMKSGPETLLMVPRKLDHQQKLNILAAFQEKNDQTEVAVVESVEDPFYLGSVSVGVLKDVLERNEDSFDLIRVVDSDNVPKVKASDSLHELLRLSFARNQRMTFFVTDLGRVVGTISISQLVEAVDEGIL